MGTWGRAAVAVVFVAAVLGAFLVLKDSRTSDTASNMPAGPSPTRPVATTPAFRVVRASVRVGQDGPLAGVSEIVAKAGDRIVITVVSTGYRGEVHLHGLDIRADVAPGAPAVIDVSQGQTGSPRGQGSFELELEATSTLIARLRVYP